MRVARASNLPAKVVFGYLGLLLATVAALMAWPFSRPLIGLLYALLAAFFLLAFAVIAMTALILAALFGGRLAGRKPRRPGTAGRASGVWDEWVDGP